jgi:hypothetical protein
VTWSTPFLRSIRTVWYLFAYSSSVLIATSPRENVARD